jgi:hypothetical protein
MIGLDLGRGLVSRQRDAADIKGNLVMYEQHMSPFTVLVNSSVT